MDREYLKGEDFEDMDVRSILLSSLAEVGLGSLLKTDVYKEAADEFSNKAKVATDKVADLSI